MKRALIFGGIFLCLVSSLSDYGNSCSTVIETIKDLNYDIQNMVGYVMVIIGWGIKKD